MENLNDGTIKIQGITLNNGKFITDEISFNTQKDEDISGFGQPVTLAAGQKMIKDFIKDVTKQTGSEKENLLNAYLDRPVAITLGKESLLHIFSQKDCEGIRFYFCINQDNQPSVVAVGVTNNPNFTHGQSLATRARDLGTSGNDITILKKVASSGVENFFYYEVGPPTTLKDINKYADSGDNFEAQLSEVLSQTGQL